MVYWQEGRDAARVGMPGNVGCAGWGIVVRALQPPGRQPMPPLRPLRNLPLFPGAHGEPEMPLPEAPLVRVLETYDLSTNNVQHDVALALFEGGIVDPVWGDVNGYGASDRAWNNSLVTIKNETGATWVEMPLDLTHDYFDSTTVSAARAPSITSFSDGVRLAHHLGFNIFVVPHLDVLNGNSWAGEVIFETQPSEDVWFNRYWQVLRPYAMAAQAEGANQFSIGTEMQTLQDSARPSSWNTLIARIKTVFHGKITYDTNWNIPYQTPPGWWDNPALSFIGVSCYYPVVYYMVNLSRQQFASDFRANVLPYLDRMARNVKCAIIITEMGYRDDSYPSYNP